MIKHKLDLLENALDSLEEALKKYEEGEDGQPKAYKFAVLHMAHFFELIFKYHVSRIHPLLIYRDPFSAKPDKSKTIGLWDAINFINNDSAEAFSKEFRSDLEWLKKLRNDIEHHKFEMDVADVRSSLGRLFRAVVEFLHKYADLDLKSAIPTHIWDMFKVLSDEYEFRLRDAMREADRIEEENSGSPNDPYAAVVRLECPNCGNYTLVVNENSDTGFQCTLCGNEESDDIPSDCDICGAPATIGELDYCYNDDGSLEGRCYYCSGRHHMDRDD